MDMATQLGAPVAGVKVVKSADFPMPQSTVRAM
jgi:hypothetical protein